MGVVLLGALLGIGCAGSMPEGLGVSAAGQLAPCPESPNCVSSMAPDEEHRIAALAISGDPGDAWSALEALLESTPRVSVVSIRDDYMHAEFTTRLMRFVDDVEFRMAADGSEIAVRSASRVGHSDMGANRDRIEWIRETLAGQGHVRVAD